MLSAMFYNNGGITTETLYQCGKHVPMIMMMMMMINDKALTNFVEFKRQKWEITMGVSVCVCSQQENAW